MDHKEVLFYTFEHLLEKCDEMHTVTTHFAAWTRWYESEGEFSQLWSSPVVFPEGSWPEQISQCLLHQSA